ncbi:MAG: hypothetical protein Q7S40_12240 [Opitutaceae bacterium]|nr:hypothetical protein [Opitutaceae bacterium]
MSSAMITGAAVFCGMFAPLVFSSVRNAIWEPLFGIGFFTAGFLFHPYSGNRVIGLIGAIAWPLLVCAIIGWGVWKLTASRSPWVAVTAALYFLSLCAWVSVKTANQLSSHAFPFYSQLSAAWY